MTLLFKFGSSNDKSFYTPGLPFYFAATLLLVCLFPVINVMKSLEHTPKRKIK
jgi:predicted outer membrane lipoprotein